MKDMILKYIIKLMYNILKVVNNDFNNKRWSTLNSINRDSDAIID